MITTAPALNFQLQQIYLYTDSYIVLGCLNVEACDELFVRQPIGKPLREVEAY